MNTILLKRGPAERTLESVRALNDVRSGIGNADSDVRFNSRERDVHLEYIQNTSHPGLRDDFTLLVAVHQLPSSQETKTKLHDGGNVIESAEDLVFHIGRRCVAAKRYVFHIASFVQAD